LKKTVIWIFVLLSVVNHLDAQERKISWEKNESKSSSTLNLFHSTEVANLPTAETLLRNEFEYEISHRFVSTLNADDAYFGIDGPAQIRMALSYAITNNLLLTFGRSNLEDNYDFRVKYRVVQYNHKMLPLLIALRAGGALNTEVYESSGEKRDKTNSKNLQYYGQAIFNTLVAKKLGIGVVPSYLYNSHILCEDSEYSFTVGSYLQYYISAMWSVFVETNTTVKGWRKDYNPFTFGVEIETGGHFFKIFFSNSKAMNPSQYLAGADLMVEDGDWRLGFNITRILKF